ncbi:hypothetical protein GHC57_13820 [Roseospira navarrensis]|uniref:Uncharacterized protein n=1 Tax=Roseospira navarrensis TaxID=140058 RepID=A0A7X2D5E2_9PROT|nr:hypothetical protein [Roseospira navarrensis]
MGAGPVAVKGAAAKGSTKRPTKAQRAWLARGLEQAGGKLPLFDHNGRRVSARLVKACLDAGWAEPWFANPLKPDWQVCKLTEAGRRVLGSAP